MITVIEFIGLACAFAAISMGWGKLIDGHRRPAA
jgi:hypothetical protein